MTTAAETKPEQQVIWSLLTFTVYSIIYYFEQLGAAIHKKFKALHT